MRDGVDAACAPAESAAVACVLTPVLTAFVHVNAKQFSLARMARRLLQPVRHAKCRLGLGWLS